MDVSVYVSQSVHYSKVLLFGPLECVQTWSVQKGDNQTRLGDVNGSPKDFHQ